MPKYAPRKCGHCAQTYTPHRLDQDYCGSTCGRQAGNLEMLRARALYRLCYYWIAGAGKGATGKLPGEIGRTIRGFMAEDQASGRPPPALPERLADMVYEAETQARYEEGSPQEAREGLMQVLPVWMRNRRSK